MAGAAADPTTTGDPNDISTQLLNELLDDETYNVTIDAVASDYGVDIYGKASFICACIMVVLCLVGTVGNSLSLFIFTRSHFRVYSINVLLAALSAVDLCLLVLAVPVFTAIPLSLMLPSVPTHVIHHLILYIYPVTVMLQCASVWLLVIITIERYVAVCHPFAVGRYCTRRRAVTAVIVTLFLAVAYNFVRFWEYERDKEGHIQALLRKNQMFLLFYQNIATTLTQFVIPLIALCSLNMQVARTIIRAIENRRQLTASERREHTDATMMLFVVLVFLFCYTFSCILNIAEILDRDVFLQPLGHFLNDVNNILVIINSSSSFLFYIKYSTRFRAELRSVLLRLCCPRWYQALLFASSTRSTFSRTSVYRQSNRSGTTAGHGDRTSADTGSTILTVPFDRRRGRDLHTLPVDDSVSVGGGSFRMRPPSEQHLLTPQLQRTPSPVRDSTGRRYVVIPKHSIVSRPTLSISPSVQSRDSREAYL
uniref:G-protein coupled receptors family 1 profile domain-containing protein n=1 Tax=Plectus sambesii TaxID=2011161 RepID=A0A914UN25_9BILA